MSKASELRDKTVDELRASEGDLRRELFNLRFQVVTGEIQNPRRIREARKEIARILTVITEKERASGEGAAAPAEKDTAEPKAAKAGGSGKKRTK